MNRNIDSSAQGNPASPSAGREMFRVAFDPGVLEAISVRDLRQLNDAVQTLAEVCSAFVCQPRFYAEGRISLAGAQMECILELLTNASEHINDASDSRVTDDVREVQYRARMRLEYALCGEESIAQIVCVAANESQTLQQARFNAQAGRGSAVQEATR